MPDYLDSQGNVIKQYLDDQGNIASSGGFIGSRLHQLSGEEPGILNPDPNKNPLLMKSILPETTESPGIIGKIRHGIYENFIRPLASPLGIYGAVLGENAPTEPIGVPSELTPKEPPLKINIGGKYEIPVVPKQLGAARDIQLPASTINQPSVSEAGYMMPGKPAELLHPNKMQPASELLSLDQIHSSPKIVESTEDINRIAPGQADTQPMTNGKDISAFRAEYSSPHIVMNNFPSTKNIIQPIMNANDEKYKWLGTIEREFSSISEGLGKQDRKNLTSILNGEEVPNASPELLARASKARDLLDSVYDMVGDSGTEMGFIDHYITHIKSSPDDIKSGIQSIISHNFGKGSGLYKIFESSEGTKPTGGLGDMYEKGLGNPNSPFTKTRSGALQDIELDYNKIIPTYLESMAKVIFDKPAIESAKDALESVPEGKLKEYLQGYIKNYTRYDADQELAGAWNSLANQIATINARSVISFNPLVHMYHAGQLPANIWPELGTKYSTAGITQFLKNPVSAYQELAKNGLFSNMIRPMKFQTPTEKFDSIAYFMNMVESLVKGTGYYGFKQKFLDSGLNEAEATMRAIAETKNATATVDPARYMRYFTPESNILGGQFSKLAKQYHQIPTKLVEQFSHAAADFQNDPSKAARYIAGTALAGAGGAIGLHTLHVRPLQLAQSLAFGGGGQFGNVMTNVMRKLSKGDVGGALGDVATWVTPGAGAKKIVFGP